MEKGEVSLRKRCVVNFTFNGVRVYHLMFFTLDLINRHTITGTSAGTILLATHDLIIHWTDCCAVWWWCHFNKRHLHWFWNLWRTLESTEVWWMYLYVFKRQYTPVVSPGCLLPKFHIVSMQRQLITLFIQCWYTNNRLSSPRNQEMPRQSSF